MNTIRFLPPESSCFESWANYGKLTFRIARDPGTTRKQLTGIGKPFRTRQELIPSTALASLSIGDNRSMCISKGSEILGLYAYLRPAPGTIPEMRLDLFGLPPHRCNQLEIVKGGSHFRILEPRKSTTD